ncbi:uncharacterized protein [Diadema antillarum]|uniref:uncharacterized protein n=1 Tax=Diadema antillarum TaxID=105358 RepID=UPI003A8A7F62
MTIDRNFCTLSFIKARWKFIRAVRMIIMQNSMNRSTAELEEDDQVLSFVSHVDGSNQPEELTFDKKYFQVKTEIMMTQEVKNALSLEPEERRPDQLRLALKGLQSISSFAEYPLHIQEKLVRVAFSYSVPEKKVIIRQGHISENFYFLVQGVVSVKKTECDPMNNEAVTTEIGRFRKGDCFGERELLHGDLRPNTITAETPCQLIAIEKEDFLDMFMGEGESGKEFEHLTFLRTLPFLKGWPVTKLNHHPQMCLIHFFKTGSVIVKDSNASDWLYIIKSGSCHVIKQLRETQSTVLAGKSRTLFTPDADKSSSFRPRDGLHIGSKIDSRRRKSSISSEAPSISINDMTPRRRRSSPGDEVKQAEKVVFVQIDVLRQKDVFGLPMLCRECGFIDVDQPSLSLVSRGAECIMINKRFFLEQANQYVYRHLKEIVRPYPLGETLQEHLQLHTDWEDYKKRAVSDVLAFKATLNSLSDVSSTFTFSPTSSENGRMSRKLSVDSSVSSTSRRKSRISGRKHSTP